MLVFVGASPATPDALVTIDLKDGGETIRATSSVGLIHAASLSEPRVISWNTLDNATAWGILYPAEVPGNEDKRPRPLIVFVHGRPTSPAPPAPSPQLTHYVTRAFHYLVG